MLNKSTPCEHSSHSSSAGASASAALPDEVAATLGRGRGRALAAAALSLALGGLASACGSDGGFEPTVAADSEGGATAGGNPATAQHLVAEQTAPGYQLATYPEGPYGVVAGTTIDDLSLLGWSNPRQSGFDMANAEVVSLNAFYDPDGGKGIELLLFNAVAIWCGVCQFEYDELDSQGIYTSLRPRGLEMIGVLFEDAEALPPRYEDMELWSKAFDVGFPFVMDPGFKTGAYFDRAATPMNMLIDAKTMEILFAFTGYTEEIYTEIDRLLTQRGR